MCPFGSFALLPTDPVGFLTFGPLSRAWFVPFRTSLLVVLGAVAQALRLVPGMIRLTFLFLPGALVAVLTRLSAIHGLVLSRLGTLS